MSSIGRSRKKLFFALLFVTSALYAADDVPVVDATGQGESVSASASQAPALPQRVAKLEAQQHSLSQLIEQVNNLQSQVQKLQGQIEEQRHEIQQMNEDLRVTKTPAPAVVPAPQAPSTALPAPSAANHSVDEQHAYQTIYNLIRNRDYVRATTALQNFVSQYPSGTYVANAHYWLGEIYLLQGQPDPAITEFNLVLNRYPTNPKVADAALKMGFAYYDKGDFDKAKGQLLKVQKQFPNTPTAQLASARLQEMKQQGR